MPKPGIYKHYKGNNYEVIGTAKHSETLEDMVVYKTLYDNPISKLWVRPKDMFEEQVEDKPRFDYISQVDPHVRVGVGVIITKDDKILMGQRKNSHGDGTWSFPGGHLEFNESLEDCVRREVMEETGLHVGSTSFFAQTNDMFDKEHKHYITLYMRTEYIGGEPIVKEPDKCETWEWFDWDDLPKPLFLCIENLIAAGHNPFT